MTDVEARGPTERAWDRAAATLYGLARELTAAADAADLTGRSDAWTRAGGLVGAGVLALLAAAGEDLTRPDGGGAGSLASLFGVIHDWAARQVPDEHGPGTC